ncbi:MAG: LEA type 2 family protein [Bacteroidales bacterium]
MKKIHASFIAITLISVLSLSGCKPYKTITVEEPEKVEIQSASLREMNLKIVLPVHNPNFYSVKLKKIDAIGYINDNEIGNIINNETLTIPANSDKSHELEININYSDLVNKNFPIMKLLKEKEVNFKIKGTLHVKSLFKKRKIDFYKSKMINMDELK